MTDNEMLDIREVDNNPALTANALKEESEKKQSKEASMQKEINANSSSTDNLTAAPKKNDGSMVSRIKNSFKRHTLWWIIGIILVIGVIALIIWGVVALVKRGKSETFVPFDPQTDPNHSTLNITPETSYLESYISSALAVN